MNNLKDYNFTKKKKYFPHFFSSINRDVHVNKGLHCIRGGGGRRAVAKDLKKKKNEMETFPLR